MTKKRFKIKNKTAAPKRIRIISKLLAMIRLINSVNPTHVKVGENTEMCLSEYVEPPPLPDKLEWLLLAYGFYLAAKVDGVMLGELYGLVNREQYGLDTPIEYVAGDIAYGGGGYTGYIRNKTNRNIVVEIFDPEGRLTTPELLSQNFSLLPRDNDTLTPISNGYRVTLGPRTADPLLFTAEAIDNNGYQLSQIASGAPLKYELTVSNVVAPGVTFKFNGVEYTATEPTNVFQIDLPPVTNLDFVRSYYQPQLTDVSLSTYDARIRGVEVHPDAAVYAGGTATVNGVTRDVTYNTEGRFFSLNGGQFNVSRGDMITGKVPEIFAGKRIGFADQLRGDVLIGLDGQFSITVPDVIYETSSWNDQVYLYLGIVDPRQAAGYVYYYIVATTPVEPITFLAMDDTPLTSLTTMFDNQWPPFKVGGVASTINKIEVRVDLYSPIYQMFTNDRLDVVRDENGEFIVNPNNIPSAMRAQSNDIFYVSDRTEPWDGNTRPLGQKRVQIEITPQLPQD